MSSASSSRPKVNLRSTAVKRIMQEANELADPTEHDFTAAPLETDIFEWHCTMRGVSGSEFDGGLYHLRILLPPSYPMSAPDIILLTPNGRFELGKKICIDGLTSFHAGSWQPAWGVRTAILGLRSFWMQGGEALSAIGALDCSKEERKRLAKLSKDWICPTCACKNSELLQEPSAAASSKASEASTSLADEKDALPMGTANTAVGEKDERGGGAAGLALEMEERADALEELTVRSGGDFTSPSSATLGDASAVRHELGPARIPPEGDDLPSDPNLTDSSVHTQPPDFHQPVSPHDPLAPPPPLPTPYSSLSADTSASQTSPAVQVSAPVPTRTTPVPPPAPHPPLSPLVEIAHLFRVPLYHLGLLTRNPDRRALRRGGVPVWLDGLIFTCASMLAYLILRKWSMGAGRDEAVSSWLREDL